MRAGVFGPPSQAVLKEDASVKASELKKGHVVRVGGELQRVVDMQHVQKGNWRSYYQIDLKNLKTGRVLTNRFATHDDVDYVSVDQRSMQYLYREGDNHCFMDNDTYEQIMIPHDDISNEIPYMKLNMETTIQFVDNMPINVALPSSVSLEVIECDPGLKGNTVSNVYKPAKLETGLEIKVPLYINPGERVKVDTRTGEFLERASTK
jgi:elongation factor P